MSMDVPLFGDLRVEQSRHELSFCIHLIIRLKSGSIKLLYKLQYEYFINIVLYNFLLIKICWYYFIIYTIFFYYM